MADEKPQLPDRFETERLILRHPVAADADAINAMHDHPAVADGVVSIPYPCPPEHGREWIEGVLKAIDERGAGAWVIEHRADGILIGDLGMSINDRHRRGEIGFLLHPDHWGKGLMTEALVAVLRWAFVERDPPVARVIADYYPSNDASRRACERLGMRREGLMRQHIFKNGEFKDLVRMAVLRDEFLALHAEKGQE